MTRGFQFDYSFIRKRRHRDPEPESDWKDQTPERRLEALEFLRKNHTPEQYAAEIIQRVYRVTRKNRVGYLVVGKTMKIIICSTFLIIMLTTGCVTTKLTRDQVQTSSTITVVSLYPDNLESHKFGFFPVMRREMDVADEHGINSSVAAAASELLENRGFQVDVDSVRIERRNPYDVTNEEALEIIEQIPTNRNGLLFILFPDQNRAYDGRTLGYGGMQIHFSEMFGTKNVLLVLMGRIYVYDLESRRKLAQRLVHSIYNMTDEVEWTESWNSMDTADKEKILERVEIMIQEGHRKTIDGILP